MSGKLKKYISENRQKFDSSEPGGDLWNKIDAQMKVPASSQISSKWLSKFKYLAFGASALIIGTFFIMKSVSNSSANEMTFQKKEPETHVTEQDLKDDPKTLAVNSNQDNETKEINTSAANQSISKNQEHSTSNNAKLNSRQKLANLLNSEKDSVSHTRAFEIIPQGEEKLNSKKDNKQALTNKKPELYILTEPVKINSYSGTIYEASDLCVLLHTYKFPGKVDLDRGSRKYSHANRSVMKTISCAHLEEITNIKGVWFKGKTDKKITLSVKDGFKNITLVKRDGREVSPEAISHYYPGLGAISAYNGKYFNIVFKDKVELLLFFKGAEEGDKILIDGVLETIIESRP